MNDTILDVRGTVFAAAIFSIYFLPPGYIAGELTNVLRFRSRSAREKLLLCLPLSLVVSTVLTNIVGRFTGPGPVQVCFLALAAITVLLVVRARKPLGAWQFSRPILVCLGMAALWTLVVIASVVDIRIGRRLYPSSLLWDHGVRIAFINSALRSNVPPANPFCFLAGHAPAARYYYYWNVLCSYPARLGHIDARYVLYGSIVWSGLCLAALIPLFLRHFFGVTAKLERKSAVGILLLSVTGLDILQTTYQYFRGHHIFADTEWWDPTQITAWHDALLWTPHHVASLSAFFFGLLILWSVQQSPLLSASRRAVAVVLAAFAFAAGAGLSVYVAFTFALVLVLWTLRLLLRRRFKDAGLFALTGCFTVLISIPYLHDLMTSGSAAATPATEGIAAPAQHFITFGLRQLPNFAHTPVLLEQHGIHITGLLMLPGLIITYLLEFGFFAVVGWSRLRRDWRNRRTLNESEIACWYLAGIALFVITFLHSAVIANNDLAFRSAMIVQFVLLLWGAEFLDGWLFEKRYAAAGRRSWKDFAVVCTLLLGVVSTIAGLATLRAYTWLDDTGHVPDAADWLPPPHRIGLKIEAIRQMYGELNRQVSPAAIVQYNPMSSDFLPFLLYDRFQSVDAFPDCGTAFGGDTAQCIPAQLQLAHLYANGSINDMQQTCRQLSIDVLIAQNTDAVWKDSRSWVWTSTPIAANEFVRAFRCP